MADWPTALADISTEVNQSPNPGFSRLLMTSGRSRQQRKYTAEPRFLSVSWKFTPPQCVIFQSFVRHTLNGGADAFMIDLPFGGGLEEVEAMFVDGKYSVRYVDGKWVVSATLEVATPPVIEYPE